MESPILLTRRSAILLAGTALGILPRLDATSGDFWDKKDPSTWSIDERDKLLTKSPWAKEISATMAPGGGGGYGSPRGGGSPGGYPGGYPGGVGIPRGRVGIGLPGGVGFPGGGRRPGGVSRGTTVKGTVRWESATPIREASKKTLPDEFDKHYVIALEGFPTMESRQRDDQDDNTNSPPNRSRDQVLDDIKQGTILQPKGRALAEAGVIQRKGSTLLFGFSKETLDLSADDKEVDFESRLPRLVVRAKFNLKEMKYHGKLAV